MTYTVTPVGSEFLVNTQTAGGQSNPTITGLTNGGFVVSWADFSSTLGDSSDASIKAQVFAADGTKVGSEFLVNTQTANQQYLPTITGLRNGGFVVTWQDLSGTLGDSRDYSCKAQVFGADGIKVGTEFLVNTQTKYNQYQPTVTGLTNGGFVVTWTDDSGGPRSFLGDGSGACVKAQVFGAHGNMVGSEFVVNTETASSQYQPTVTGLANGGFVVSWTDYSGTLGDNWATSIKAQVFDPDGVKISSEFLVNTQTAWEQDSPKITGLTNGGFVITWKDLSGTLGDASHLSCAAQVFAADGTKVGTEFLVNTQTEGEQTNPSYAPGGA